LKTQHQITAVIINKINLFKHEITDCKCKQNKTGVIIAIVLKCSRLNVSLFICNIFNLKRWKKNKKYVKNVKE